MLIIQIALGIILAVIILACFPLIVGLLGIGLWLGVYIILFFLVLGGLSYFYELMPKEWIQLIQDYFWVIGLLIIIYILYEDAKRSESFIRITESKTFSFFARKIIFVEKVFGENSAQIIMSNVFLLTIFTIFFLIPCFFLFQYLYS